MDISDNTSSALKTQVMIKIKNPFIDTYRLIFNPEWSVLYEKYESMNMEIPKSEEVEKYIKLPYSLNGYSNFSFTRDFELPNCTLIEFQEIEHLIDMKYEDLMDKILALYGED